MPDMGDRDPARPLSKNKWLVNPIGLFRADFRESPAITVAATLALVIGIGYIANDAERQYRARRGATYTSAVTAAPAAAVATTGDAAQDSVKVITDAADKAVTRIEQATNNAVDAIKSTASNVTE